MCPLQYQFVISLLLLHVSYCQRRIVNGDVPALDQPFMVYFVKASVSPEDYDEWVCGGALITNDLIVTSAACVEDVKYMYAIAGYNKYINDAAIDTDPCTSSKMKKKVIMTCVPKSYELDYDKLEKWSFIDIAVAQVESPYREDDIVSQCSYGPKPIQVNFEEKYQAPSTDAMVLGWGHKEKWRREDDSNTYNSEDLQAALVTLADKDECKKEYLVFPGMETVIDKYMICSIGPGNIDSKGEMLVTSAPSADGCANGRRSKTCDDTSSDLVLVENIRRKGLSNMTKAENSKNNTKDNIKSEYNMKTNTIVKSNLKNNANVENELKNNTSTENGLKNNKQAAYDTKLSKKETKLRKDEKNNTIPFRFMNTRRQGICQNDHGGPIVTWAGGHEILIGVASVFKIAGDYKCEGPFLYTSTQCNGAFLNCIMTHASTENGRFCDSAPEVKGFKMVTKHISWTDHPDGPSEKDLQLNKTSSLNLNTDRPSDRDYKINETSSRNLNTNGSSDMDHKLNKTSANNLKFRTSETDQELNMTSTRTTDKFLKVDFKLNTASTPSFNIDRSSKLDVRLNVTSTRNLSQLNTSTTSSKLNLNQFNKSMITSTVSPFRRSNVFLF